MRFNQFEICKLGDMISERIDSFQPSGSAYCYKTRMTHNPPKPAARFSIVLEEY